MTTPKLEPHPFSLMFPPIAAEDFAKLAADIKLNGLHQPIVRYQGKILDGNNRYRACALAGIEPTFADFTGIDADAKAYVISMNINRRHLDLETRKKIVAELFKLDPTLSDRQAGEQSKLDHKTAAAVREGMEQRGEIPHAETRTDSTGRSQPSKKGKAKGKGRSKNTGKKESIQFLEVVNASTALNAYNTLQQRLLDALEFDVGKYCDLSQVKDCAYGTADKLEERLNQILPEEEEVTEAA